MDFPKYDEEPLSPAGYAHFGPAKVVYYVRRFHITL